MESALRNETRQDWIRVFCPDTRILSPEEISVLSPEEKREIEAGGQGVWLEVRCPEKECLIGENMMIPVRGVEHKEEDLWDELFCPQDSCVFQSPTDLP